jgi:hypothetical protein
MIKSGGALAVILVAIAVGNITAPARADTSSMTPLSQSVIWGSRKAYSDGEPMIQTAHIIEKIRARVIQQVQSNWSPPCIDGSSHKVVLNFRFSKDGNAVDVRVARSSGYAALDKAAIHALEQSADFDGCVAPFAFLFSVYGESTFEVVFDAAGSFNSPVQLKQIHALPVVKDDDISLDLSDDELAAAQSGVGQIKGHVVHAKPARRHTTSAASNAY